MRKIKVLFYIVTFIMLVGGILGIIKGVVSQMEWLSFRSLLGMGATYKASSIPAYAVVFGVFIAVLEIISAILLLTKKRRGIQVAIITLSINAFGCIIAIFIGDIMAAGSLILRFFAVYILIKYKNYYVGRNFNTQQML